MFKRTLVAAAAAASIAAFSGPAAAQQAGLVNVGIGDVDVQLELTEVLSRNNVTVQIPATVQIPIGLAANICGTTVAVLSNTTSNPVCNADADAMNQGHAQAVARAIQRQQQ